MMKKKINTRFYLVSAISILVTMIILLFVFYSVYKKQIMADLKIYSNIIISQDAYTNWDDAEIRVTYIDSSGKVLFDSQADVTKMENHLTRPEVQTAIADGSGYALRKSNTLGKTTFYYAVLLEDGKILERGSFEDLSVSSNQRVRQYLSMF